MKSDVVIRSTADKLAHKWEGNVPADHECYWTVSGTPRQTTAGNRIWFVRENHAFATAEITDVEDGRIWFEPLRSVDMPMPEDAPTRGFRYINPAEI